jgi:coenzyme F420-0:L-glutamate ligase/coenzyme F420-1:gamma-L-glutamate ligase
MSRELRVLPVEVLPEVEEGMKLGELIAERAELQPGDIVVISQKIVSKAEGRVRRLADIEPSAEARELAEKLGKEAALVELVRSESREVLRAEHGVLITETHHGFVCANAGIDASNLPEDGTVCLLPADPDTSARTIRTELTTAIEEGPRPSIAVVITDSFGRAWRLGQAEVAIGCAGLAPLDDWRGRADANGRELTATAIAIADQIAAAADLVRIKDSGVPAAIVRGLKRHLTAEDGPGAAALRRPLSDDLFR